jgi:hypothetical protein
MLGIFVVRLSLSKPVAFDKLRLTRLVRIDLIILLLIPC